jgi:hypothetical protein
VDSNELLVVIRRAAERHVLDRENARLREELELALNTVGREAAEAGLACPLASASSTAPASNRCQGLGSRAMASAT